MSNQFSPEQFSQMMNAMRGQILSGTSPMMKPLTPKSNTMIIVLFVIFMLCCCSSMIGYYFYYKNQMAAKKEGGVQK